MEYRTAYVEATELICIGYEGPTLPELERQINLYFKSLLHLSKCQTAVGSPGRWDAVDMGSTHQNVRPRVLAG